MGEKINFKLFLLLGVFITSILIANIVAPKMFMIWGFTLTVGTLIYPITFACTDVISDVWGKTAAKWAVWVGFITNVLMLGLFYIARIIPGAPWWGNQAAFDTVLGAVPRIVGASMVAYLISQHMDVITFHFFKKKTNGRKLWLRNNLSTMSSQFIDSIVFITLAFAGLMPFDKLIGMVLVQYVAKVAIAALDTAPVYALVAWAKR